MQPKRLITSLLVAILILSLAVVSIAAKESSALEMSVEVSTSTDVYSGDGNPVFKKGEIIDVSVVINSNPGLEMLGFYLEYDPEMLELSYVYDEAKGKDVLDVTYTSTLKMSSKDQEFVTPAASGNALSYMFMADSGFASGVGTLYSVRFKVLNDTVNDKISIKIGFPKAGTYISDSTGKTINPKDVKTNELVIESHEYELGEVHAPTCTKEGYTEAVCKNCPEKAEPDRVNIKPALGHEPGDLIAEKPATCEEKGLLAHYICKREGCGKLLVKDGEEIKEATAEDFVIDAKGHKYGDLIAAKDATCTEKGNKAYYQCSECKKYFDSEKVETTWDKIELPVNGHTYGKLVPEKKPTCIEKGNYAYYQCAVCKKYFDAEKAETTWEKLELPINPDNHVGGTYTLKADEDITCTKGGYTGDIYCNSCKKLLEEGKEIEPKPHELTSEITAPTCEENGYTTYKCKDCTYTAKNLNEGDDVPALGHDKEEHLGQAATCTEKGWNTYYTCKRVGCKYTTYVEIPALGHDWIVTQAQPATCTESGWFEYSACKREGCDQKTEIVEIPALGHALQHVDAVAPTCEDIGWDNYDYCTRCDYTTYVELPALKHKMVTVKAKEATCEEDGYKAYAYCENCYFDAPDAVEIEIISATGHNIVAISTVSPECEKTGYVYYECLNHCGYEETVITDALGHDVRLTETLLPTCTADGYVKQACAREGCDFESQITIKATGHVIVDVPAVAATCTVNGMTAGKQCTVCGVYTEKPSVVAAEGHKYVELPIAATCTNQGSTVKTCSVCAAVALDNFIPALGHDYVIAKTEASCTGDGFTTYTCSKCADKYVADITNALGHKPGAAATCTENQVCQTCQAVLAEAKGHDWYLVDEKKATKDEDGWNEHFECAVCGEKHENYEVLKYEGCGSVIGGCGAIVSLVAILGGAWITSKKKH